MKEREGKPAGGIPEGSGTGQKKGRRRRTALWIVLGILAALVIAGGVYFGTYYHADEETVAAALESDDVVNVSRTTTGYFFDGPATDTAIIFYPGAKVETTAYAPLLHLIATKDADVILVDMPLHMAIFDVDRAEKVRENYQGWKNWYMAGHSLGAAVAGMYVADHLDAYEGLIFLAGYPTKDLHRDGFSLLSVYGSNDGNAEMLQRGAEYRPEDYTEVVIEGGNHAQFGDYGIQSGDGTATISAKEQQEETAEAVWAYLEAHAAG